MATRLVTGVYVRTRERRARPDAWGTLLVALLLCLVTFIAKGGLSSVGFVSAPLTYTEMALTIGGGFVIAMTTVLGPSSARLRDNWPWPVIGMLALAALTVLSVLWSVLPDGSWQEANRTLAYVAVFVAAARVAICFPARSRAVLAGTVLGAVVVCGYALQTKVFPAQLDPNEVYARLQGPYGYWNATGLMAAMGVVACVWLGSRRAGHGALNAVAYPAAGLLLVTLFLTYSRGALLALVIGLVVWFTAVPLRLRGAMVLLVAGAGAGAVLAWAFSRAALTQENVALAVRSSDGHRLGVLLVLMIFGLLVAGVAIRFLTARQPPSIRARRRAGGVLLALLGLAPVIVVLALLVSPRGLTGTISHDFHTLTNLNPSVSNSETRLTALGSTRALYWDEAFEVWQAHPILGVGAGGFATARLRYATNPAITVQHAHSYVMQTLADFGLVGLAVSLIVFTLWFVAAAHSARPWSLRWVKSSPRKLRTFFLTRRLRRVKETYTAERVDLLAMFAIVFVFGAHSLVDWTWFVPGTACVGLLCAGWLAGRRPLGPQQRRIVQPEKDTTHEDQSHTSILTSHIRLPRRFRPRGELGLPLPAGTTPRHVAISVAIIVFALVAAWSQWQPLRSSDAADAALFALEANHVRQALDDAERAVHLDPLSATARVTLADLQVHDGQNAAAQTTLEEAVRLQPANPETWVALGEFEDTTMRDPRAALKYFSAGLYLAPSPEITALWLQADRASGT